MRGGGHGKSPQKKSLSKKLRPKKEKKAKAAKTS